jgi:hypothetical protein
MIKLLENVEEVKRSLNMLVFDGYSDEDIEHLWSDFNNKFNSINGFKEDINGMWGEGYYVCVDKNNNILFEDISINFNFNDKYCVNKDGELYFNVDERIDNYLYN